jgi:hypothetical protein
MSVDRAATTALTFPVFQLIVRKSRVWKPAPRRTSSQSLRRCGTGKARLEHMVDDGPQGGAGAIALAAEPCG